MPSINNIIYNKASKKEDNILYIKESKKLTDYSSIEVKTKVFFLKKNKKNLYISFIIFYSLCLTIGRNVRELLNYAPPYFI